MVAHHYIKKIVLSALIIVVLLYLVRPEVSLTSQVYYFLYPKKSIQCYHSKGNTLPDISENPPRTNGKTIFFHETSCNSHFNGKITLTPRQACAVESAAKLNPHYEVFLLFASPGVLRFEGWESDRVLQALLSYQNVRINHIDYEEYTRGTPVEELYRKGKVEGSGYAQSHASDVLRYLTLWKYGGIYLDLDVIVTKTLEELPPNYAGSESERNVAAGVLSFSPAGRGHALALRCLNDLNRNFKGYDWGYNGPGVITRLLKNICGVEIAKEMLLKDCEGFSVYPPDAFYAIPWWNWTMYFDEDWTDHVVNVSKNSYVIHVWNKHSSNSKIPVSSKAAYAVYARNYCPKVFNECSEVF